MGYPTIAGSLILLVAAGCTMTPDQVGHLLQAGASIAAPNAGPRASQPQETRNGQLPPPPGAGPGGESASPKGQDATGPMPPPRGGGGQVPPPPPAGPGPEPPAPPEPPADQPESDLPALYRKFAPSVTITRDGDMIRLTTQDIPDHKSPYFGSGHAQYQAPHEGMVVNPNRIQAQNYVLRVPAQPAVAESITPTHMDAIGIALNGVVLFNQYAAGMQPLTNEIATFDIFRGHPAQKGQYHYHIEPPALTDNDANLVGVMLDGFPLYGQKDADGTTPALDEANGHFGPTPDFPAGIYHYHVTSAPPYFCGGFRGTKGTWTNS